MSAEVVRMETQPSDTDRAAQMRARVWPALEQIAAEMNQADRDGFILGFSLARNQFGRFSPFLEISKRLV